MKPLTLEEIQERANDNFIVLDSEIKEYGNQGRSQRYISTECKKCGYLNSVILSNAMNKKIGCPSCSGKVPWTLEKIRERSKDIHKNKFIIYALNKRRVGSQQLTRQCVDIECKFCGHANTVLIGDFLKGSNCGGGCRGTGHRETQISFLRNNPMQANELYKLYFLKFTHKVTYEEFYKVGKTNKVINARFSGRDFFDYNIEECQIVEGTHLWVAEQEDEFINKHYNRYGYKPKNKFSGYTECFRSDIIQEF